MHRTLIFFLISAIATGAACTMSKESPFFAKFSTSDLVTSNKSFKAFQCDPLGGGGGGGGTAGIFSSSGGLGRGGMQFHSHKSDSFSCRLHSDTLPVADEEQLIASLKKQVEDSLRAYGANISESGSRNSHSFYFSYAIKDIQGRVQVSGKRSPADYYNFQAELEESK
jgi:hypothetical protein